MNKNDRLGAFKHIEKFIKTHGVIKPGASIIIGVSAGMDSVFLAHALVALKENLSLGNIEILYVDHGTRVEEIKKEIFFVKNLAQSLNCNFTLERIDLNFQLGNFEHQARELRHQIFQKHAKQRNALIALGHHIDDSFEWSLMQQLKSSNHTANLGIPLKNGKIRRPLMCLTKRQIQRICQVYEISYLYDSSNANSRFERNYLRQEVIPAIEKRFPSYLKHYVERSNRRAIKLKCHTSSRETRDCFTISSPVKGVKVLWHNSFSNDFIQARNQIYSIIHELSTKSRGSLVSQVSKLIEGAKQSRKGPFLFSGGVQAILIPGAIFFYNDVGQKELARLDQKLINLISQNSNQFFQKRKSLKSPINRGVEDLFYLESAMTYWPKSKKFRPIRSVHPLIPKTSAYFLEHKLAWQWVSRFFALGLNK